MRTRPTPREDAPARATERESFWLLSYHPPAGEPLGGSGATLLEALASMRDDAARRRVATHAAAMEIAQTLSTIGRLLASSSRPSP